MADVTHRTHHDLARHPTKVLLRHSDLPGHAPKVPLRHSDLPRPTHDLPRHAPKVPLRADVGPGTEDHVEAHLVSHLQVFPAQSTVNKMTLSYYVVGVVVVCFLVCFWGGWGGTGIAVCLLPESIFKTCLKQRRYSPGDADRGVSWARGFLRCTHEL